VDEHPGTQENDTMAAATRSVPIRSRPAHVSRVVSLLVLMAFAVSVGIAQDSQTRPKGGSQPSSPAKKKEKTLLAARLDALGLPANAIVVIYEKVAEGLGSNPVQIILSPAAYKKIMDENAELRRRLAATKPAPPSTCQLTVVGSMDGDSIHLRATFKFKAEKDKTLVALGCAGASPQKPELDGQETLLQNAEDGLVAEVGAGQHVLTLELDAPVKSGDTSAVEGGAKRVVKIDLPRAAVTTLEIEQLPGGVEEARCNGQVIRKAGATVALGAAKELTLSWVRLAPLPADGPWLTADGSITVRVEEKDLVTEAMFTLQDLRKRNTRWILETPPLSTAEVISLDKGEARIPAHTITSDKNKQHHVIVLKEPMGEAFGVFLRSRQPRPPTGRILIGPFQVLQAAGRLRKQQGIIRIKAPPSGVRLIYRPAAEALFHVSPDELTDKDRLDSVLYRFKYWSLPQGTGPVSPRVAPLRPYLLELEAKAVTGIVQTRVEHLLELREKEGAWEVQATTEIHAKPVRAGVDVIEIQLPRSWPTALPIAAAWPRPGLPINLALLAWAGDGLAMGILWPFTAQYKIERSIAIADRTGLTDSIEDFLVDRAGKVRVFLPEKRDTDFTLTVKGAYALAAGASRAVLELPRPLNTSDQGGEVRIVAPSNQQLLLGDTGQETPAPEPSRHRISSEATPDRVEFGWRPFRPELPVTILTDVTLANGKADMRQRIHFPGQKPIAAVWLRLPTAPELDPAVKRAIERSFRILSGKQPKPIVRLTGSGPWPIPLACLEDRSLVLRYQLPVAATGLASLPLFWLDQATQVDAKVRVWSLPGSTLRTLAALKEGLRWTEEKIEIAPERDYLPILVLRGQERDMPLTLRLHQAPGPALATTAVERGLIRVTTLPGGGHSYRARFRLARLGTPALEVELPAGASRLVVRLNGVTPPLLEPDTTEGRKGSVRLLLDTDRESSRGPVLLELGYELGPSGGAEKSSQDDVRTRLGTTLYPPVLPGALFVGKTRWQVDPAPGQLFLNPGWEATSEQRWGLRGWLPAPGPALESNELDCWLPGTEPEPGVEPALVCWQTAPEPLHLILVPAKTWLLICSLLFLALGLALSFAPLLRGPLRVLSWVTVALVGLAGAAAATLWPGILPEILYGCEPGLAVLIPIVVVHWMVQKRYRRQLVFMPGFTRLKAGSSMVRAGSGTTRPTEPSTVDKQPAAEGAQPRTGS
jgi:hypothetical protein